MHRIPRLTFMLRTILLILALPLSALSEERDLIASDQFFSWQYVILPPYKLMFCRIHKAGSTGLNHVVSALVPPRFPQRPEWTVHGASDYGLTASDVSNLLRDQSWFKAFIYREPLERFLSAYRSKCEGYDAPTNCHRAFHTNIPTFSGAIRRMILREDYFGDDHFEPQANYCNLRQTLPYFNESFLIEPETSSANIRHIFRHAHVEINEEVSGLLDIYFAPAGTEGDLGHNTHSSDVSSLLEYYNHDCYIRLMVYYFREDYDLLHISIPDWAVGPLERVTLEECMEIIKTH